MLTSERNGAILGATYLDAQHMPLTNTQAKNAKPRTTPYTLTDGKGMYLLVQPSGSKLWRYRYRLNGKQKQYAIGVYPEVGLAEARVELDRLWATITQRDHHHDPSRVSTTLSSASVLAA